MLISTSQSIRSTCNQTSEFGNVGVWKQNQKEWFWHNTVLDGKRLTSFYRDMGRQGETVRSNCLRVLGNSQRCLTAKQRLNLAKGNLTVAGRLCGTFHHPVPLPVPGVPVASIRQYLYKVSQTKERYIIRKTVNQTFRVWTKKWVTSRSVMNSWWYELKETHTRQFPVQWLESSLHL